ncbi:hypothetical protein BJ508DRAFT_305670 [Ascobolus immersus RN42]|uniref:GRF-type domain-containing protein n=1 Tax=Ascobolus immersus RN42 TaxID=1160509 RepID=A0A3N4I8Y5_ASCIM|nr:hypothetical protein BJ508DRAFT_305670 [Ascobolus immersus RN42]
MSGNYTHGTAGPSRRQPVDLATRAVYYHGIWYCFCDEPKPCVLLYSRKEKSYGKPFYRCPDWADDPDTCDLFLWKAVADELVRYGSRNLSTNPCPFKKPPPAINPCPRPPPPPLPLTPPPVKGSSKAKGKMKENIAKREQSTPTPSLQRVLRSAAGSTSGSRIASEDDSLAISISDLSISCNPRHVLSLTVGSASANARGGGASGSKVSVNTTWLWSPYHVVR